MPVDCFRLLLGSKLVSSKSMSLSKSEVLWFDERPSLPGFTAI